MATEETSGDKDGFQPGHDIFYTPGNTSFYAAQPYSKLNPARQEIRLLRLLPYSGHGLVECELLEATALRDVKGQYTALSYCAGSPRETNAILLDGSHFNVFASLGHALKEIRNFWDKTFGDKECVVWIDQICINQNDIGERSHQVWFMREIYEYSEQVLVCLSIEEMDPKGMDWLLGLVEYVGSDQANVEFLDEHLQNSLGDTSFVAGWAAFYDVAGAPWWKRSWVFQEFIVAPNVYFMYSGRFASWQNISFVFDSIFYHHYYLKGPSLYGAPLSKIKNPNMDLLKQRINDCRSEAVLDTMNSMLINRKDWRGTIDLKKLLHHSRHCKSSDPRDKVFAFLGLADVNYGILPDYSHTLAQVLTATTMKIIEYEDSLDILYDAALSHSPPRADGLESWVLDWTCEELSSNDTELWGGRDLVEIYGLNRERAHASFHSLETPCGVRNALKIRGVLIDVIESIVEIWPTSSGAPSTSYRSSKDYLIVGSCFLQSGDQVWVLDGAGLPFVLRAQGEYGYILVSGATISANDSLSQQDWLQRLLDAAKKDQGGWQTVFLV